MSRKEKPLFTGQEKKGIYGLSCIFFTRMLGLFLLLPVFSTLAIDLEKATIPLVGLAFGVYGLTQAFLQIPFGMISDKIGRKPVIFFSLVVFIIGSVIGAYAEDIYAMIFARCLQGAGALSSTVFALIGDITRPGVRSRANAFLGGSIGIAFMLSIIIAPFLGNWIGLSGIFLLITALAFFSLIILYTLVPTVPHQVENFPQQKILSMLSDVLKNKPLGTLNIGSFVTHGALAAVFFAVPLTLQNYGFHKAELWKIYIPMLFVGLGSMIPAVIIAETKNKFREVMLFGIATLTLSFLILFWGQERGDSIIIIAGLFIFFLGFNIFEPIFSFLSYSLNYS